MAPAPPSPVASLTPRSHRHPGRQRGRQLCLGARLEGCATQLEGSAFPTCLAWWKVPLCLTQCDSEGRAEACAVVRKQAGGQGRSAQVAAATVLPSPAPSTQELAPGPSISSPLEQPDGARKAQVLEWCAPGKSLGFSHHKMCTMRTHCQGYCAD